MPDRCERRRLRSPRTRSAMLVASSQSRQIISARKPMPSWTENAPSRASDAPATSESAAAANPNQPRASGATRVRMILEV